jgi:hypothetical protein
VSGREAETRGPAGSKLVGYVFIIASHFHPTGAVRISTVYAVTAMVVHLPGVHGVHGMYMVGPIILF